MAWSGANEVHKGRSYVKHLDELLAQPTKTGLALSGTAYGQEEYQAQATLEGGQVARARCSCPVGGGGHCKHVAALLTRYAQASGDFLLLSPLTEALGRLDTQQLHQLIEQMLTAAPELRGLVDRFGTVSRQGQPQTNAKAAASLPALFLKVKRKYNNGWQYGDAELDTEDLADVLDEADVLWEAQPQQALDIYLAMLNQIDAAYASWADEGDEAFDDLLDTALAGVLSLVSEHKLPAKERQRAVAAVFNLDEFSVLAHNAELADFADELTQAERMEFLSRLKRAHDRAAPYQRPVLAQMRLSLVPKDQRTPAQHEALLLGRGDDAEITGYFLSQAASQSATKAAHGKLLTHLTQTQPRASLEPLFSLFAHHDAEALLEKIIAARQGQGRGMHNVTPELHWLFARYAATNRREQAFELAWKGFVATASPAWEQLLRQVSLDWPRDWQRALKAFEKQPGLCGAVLNLLLEGDHELAEAVAYDRAHAQQLEQSGGYSVSYSSGVGLGISNAPVREELARRLGELPEYQVRAADIRLERAASLIHQRGRANYQAAAEQLGFLAHLIGQEAAQRRIAELAQANKALRALQEELRDVGLL